EGAERLVVAQVQVAGEGVLDQPGAVEYGFVPRAGGLDRPDGLGRLGQQRVGGAGREVGGPDRDPVGGVADLQQEVRRRERFGGAAPPVAGGDEVVVGPGDGDVREPPLLHQVPGAAPLVEGGQFLLGQAGQAGQVGGVAAERVGQLARVLGPAAVHDRGGGEDAARGDRAGGADEL